MHGHHSEILDIAKAMFLNSVHQVSWDWNGDIHFSFQSLSQIQWVIVLIQNMRGFLSFMLF